MTLVIRSASSLRVLRSTEIWGLTVGVLLIGALHVVAPTNSIDPLRVTISEYGRSPFGAVFVSGVLLIAIGSAATLAQLVRGGVCRPVSLPSIGIALWIAGMMGVAVFQKADWSAGVTWTGLVHRGASVVAFIALPVAILALSARRIRARTALGATPGSHRLHVVSLALALMTLAAIAVLAVVIGFAEASLTPWWTLFPIGLAERLLVFTELAALATAVIGLRLAPVAQPSVARSA